ncbi:MAG: putative type modification enzyme [Symbiobacteriaceae bacterium]|nr:putative type modification enzyme [Symbiobacteriaceae bacterium]
MSALLSFRPSVLTRLRDGVVESCRILGAGYLALPENVGLRERVASGVLSPQAYYQQLLWLVFGVLFRAAAEGRQPGVQALLGLPGPGGLFARGRCPDLDEARLADADAQAVLRALHAPECREMASEELGAVYDGLLQLQPFVDAEQGTFGFLSDAGARGSERKATGAYYTPPELVAELIRSTLDPVIAQAVAARPQCPRQAIVGLTVIDPACGSGHFLLAAARRMAAEIVRLTPPVRGASPEQARSQALHEVISNAIHGADKNPLAVELCRAALWLELGNAGAPLSALDAQIQCGDALIGLRDPAVLAGGIPVDAYKALTGDEPAAERELRRRAGSGRGGSTPGVLAKPAPADAADLYVAAFFLPKRLGTLDLIPHNCDLTDGARPAVLAAARHTAAQHGFLHWHLAFPAAMARGGFDVVLTNPPWEKLKLQEQEFFASRSPAIAGARHKAAREQLIERLGGDNASAADRLLRDAFVQAKRTAEAASLFIRKGGRFPLTGNGDVNTYALFAETVLSLLRPGGRAGLILPTGIATDDSTKRFFTHITNERQLISLYSFYEIRRWFPGTEDRKPFALLTLGGHATGEPVYGFEIDNIADVADHRRVFSLAPSDIRLINPNTGTCPLFRSKADAEITKGIYARVPVLIDKQAGTNPWGIRFLRMFDMSGDSGLFRTAAQLAPAGARGERWLPLYEAKMIHQFDHRFGTFAGLPGRPNYAPVARPTDAELADPAYDPDPWYWVPAEEAKGRIAAAGWGYDWLFGLRSITNAAAERTVIGTAFPVAGAGNSLPLLLPLKAPSPRHLAGLIGNLSALILDFHARQKVGGINLNFFIIEQLAVLPPDAYTEEDLAFIVPRVLELTYTSESMRPFARALGCARAPFAWHPGRRALLRAELDARYARLYGLTLDQLRYILDPGPDYPSQTFRVLKENELKQFGEHRTQRLVLEAWHRCACR